MVHVYHTCGQRGQSGVCCQPPTRPPKHSMILRVAGTGSEPHSESSQLLPMLTLRFAFDVNIETSPPDGLQKFGRVCHPITRLKTLGCDWR